MGTETLSFWLLEPEKNAFKDGNPTFKIMTKRELFFGAISLGVFTDVLRDGTPCTFEYPIQQVSNKTHYKIAKRIKKKYLKGRCQNSKCLSEIFNCCRIVFFQSEHFLLSLILVIVCWNFRCPSYELMLGFH